MKKGIIITAAVLIVIGFTLFICALFAVGFDLTKLGTAKYETNAYGVEESFTNIEIDTKETDIEFKQSEDGGVKVVCYERDKVKHSVKVENGTLKIRVEDKRSRLDHINLFSKSLSLTVYLPSGTYGSLSVGSSTGSVKVPGDYSFDSVDITASTGSISCDASAAGSFRIKTSTGSISCKGISAKTIDLSVSTGDVTLGSAACSGTVSVSVSTGGTNVEGLRCRDFSSKGTVGKINMKDLVAEESLYVERSTGDIVFESCDAGSIIAKASTGDVTGSLKTEKIFYAKASTGRVNVPKGSSGGLCEITTSTGDIDIRIEDNGGSSLLN